MSKRVLLVAAKTGYQVREFYGAAERLGVELVLATDRCHVLDDPWADQATPVQFAEPEAGIAGLAARGPFQGILAVGDQPALVAAQIANRLGLRFHGPETVLAANDKFLTRECFRSAGLLVPTYSLDPAYAPRYPCVVKPLHFAASRGVIRANNPEEFDQARKRIRNIASGEPILVEDFIPGREFALEGVVTSGRLQTLAIFDKPDPLDGPYFEETTYVTPSREVPEIQEAIKTSTQQAVNALNLSSGPVHAEMRVNSLGVWMLEIAARPIGGLCARVLRFKMLPSGTEVTLEEILLRQALGEDVSSARLITGSHAVMMIPIPESGIFAGVNGLDEATTVPGITALEITAKEGQKLQTLPEGASYLGFIFARSKSPEDAEHALRLAHGCLRFQISRALPVVR
jgi:biotin carboxylase